MSLQALAEAQIVSMLESNIGELSARSGAVPLSLIDGGGRHAAVRQVSASAERFAFAQSQWTEVYAVTIFWPATIDRADRITEWEAFRDALLADADLGAAVEGLIDAYASEYEWGDAADGSVSTLTASITTVRIE